jgi:hypothetical protein
MRIEMPINSEPRFTAANVGRADIPQTFKASRNDKKCWLGREDSNLRMVESKSTALPLGDAPIDCRESGGTGLPRIPSGNAGL